MIKEKPDKVTIFIAKFGPKVRGVVLVVVGLEWLIWIIVRGFGRVPLDKGVVQVRIMILFLLI